MENILLSEYISIGEFSKLCGVSRKTLIFYDNIGIFSPAYKNDKNYRYYTINQFDTFSILTDLRELGMSLNDIKDYLKKKSPENYLNMLKQENDKIKERINKLKRMSNNIENKIEIANRAIDAKKYEGPYIKKLDKEYLVVSDLCDSSQETFMIDIIKFLNYCNLNNLDQGYPIGVMISGESIKNKEYTKISKLFLKNECKLENCDIHIKKEGLYACIVHKGSYEKTYESYEKLLKYISDCGYEVEDCSYENTLLDFFAVKNEDQYLTEISIPIRKMEIT
ncbi:MerR family transcriptional regulator [Tepidibacter hydrothermalis]|uniref:MerR family transcriptional regulator n=1 Tax=Tepidibacter hydrothermalis TaxID=3036126 RepID=A0ABY8E7I0_9FIRM|nr:MerR family transcriptional regulator [Tepidibacter hydrothermalis]WFD08855.1 MerR family transcriptional regulator [Tepidibacter hydrothermalis]